MRTFYVTPSKDVRDYVQLSTYTRVHADEVNVGPAGELAFCNNVEDDKVFVVTVFAPGSWVTFTESKE